MITSLDCIPCLLRQVIEASRFFYADEKLQEKIMRDMLMFISESGFSEPPPVIAQKIHRRLKEVSGIDDPYRGVKDRFNSMALSMLDTLAERIENSPEPMLDAVKLSIAGNVIDCGAKTGLSESEVRSLIDVSFLETVEGDVDRFLQKAARAEKILFIADNAGEIVFDRPLIERLGAGRVTVAVRGFPVINDATIQDAYAAGIDRIAAVMENGSDAPGTILNECSDEFIKCYNEADLVIAKGQGNYETLCDEKKQVFFLLKVKCHIIADHTGFPVGTHAVINLQAEKAVKELDTSAGKTTPPVSFKCTPIGIIHSEHVNPSETPIQPVYAKGCRGYIEVFPEYVEGLKDLEGFSHIYILFHLHRSGPPKLLVKPFLDVVQRGVFATRAPARPNPIGMSIVELIKVEGAKLYLDGIDMLDGTPVIDIKPYASRFDRIDTTRNGWHDSVEEADAVKRGVRSYKGKFS